MGPEYFPLDIEFAVNKKRNVDEQVLEEMFSVRLLRLRNTLTTSREARSKNTAISSSTVKMTTVWWCTTCC